MALCDELEARLTTMATTRRQLPEATLDEALNNYSGPRNAGAEYETNGVNPMRGTTSGEGKWVRTKATFDFMNHFLKKGV
jgi:hypothetical protein